MGLSVYRWLGRSLIAGLVLGLTTGAKAGDELDALAQFSETVQSMSATFSQVTTDVDGFVLDRSEGHFYFQKPSLFRWSYSEPFEEVIVGDGEMLWHFDPNLDQVTVRAQQTMAQSPILTLTDWASLNESFALTADPGTGIVELSPKDSQSGIELAWVLLVDGLPKSVGWADRFSQRTVIEFEGLEINVDLDNALFKFEPPDGVDVLQGL